jgi:hypothetical protein
MEYDFYIKVIILITFYYTSKLVYKSVEWSSVKKNSQDSYSNFIFKVLDRITKKYFKEDLTTCLAIVFGVVWYFFGIIPIIYGLSTGIITDFLDKRTFWEQILIGLCVISLYFLLRIFASGYKKK